MTADASPENTERPAETRETSDTRAISLTLVRRGGERGAAPRARTHELTIARDTTLLAALHELRSEQEPGLAFRASCRHGICGDCTVRVNGQPRQACTTLLWSLADAHDGPVVVEPLAGFSVIRDLVVDLEGDGFWRTYRDARPWLEPGREPPAREYRVTPEEHARAASSDSCILCGACFSVCPITRSSGSAFVGPHALLKVHGRVLDPRDGAPAERLAQVAGDFGAFRCHGVFSCIDACPMGLDPADVIGELRQLARPRRRRALAAQRRARQAQQPAPASVVDTEGRDDG